MERRIYIAYGEYMSIMQMASKCVTAKRIGRGFLRHWRLSFHGEMGNGIENIIPSHNDSVPITLWDISLDDERELDTRYEYPKRYTKIEVEAVYKGAAYKGYTYIINGNLPYATPSQALKDCMKEGYSDTGIAIKDWDPIFF